MDFSFKTTLTRKAGIKVISLLWNQPDVIQDIKNLIVRFQKCETWRSRQYQVNREIWKSIENNVISKLHKIILPNHLKLMLFDLVQPMGREIYKWIHLACSAFNASSSCPDTLIFVWTDIGVLDYSKIAEIIIKSSQNKILCFTLACIFGIEETIFNLWPDVRSVICSKVVMEFAIVEYGALLFWTSYLENKTGTLLALTEHCGIQNPYELGFILLLNTKCVSPLNYFLKFIQPERKRTLILLALDTLFSVSEYCDGYIVMFLFNHLTEHDIEQVINENCHPALSSFLDWPCQDFFISLANKSWNQLSNIDYSFLWHDIVEKVSNYHLSNTYKSLFRDFFKCSPPAFKEYIIDKCTSGSFLNRFFSRENIEGSIQVFFNGCTSEEKRQMIFYFEGMKLCDLLVKTEKWSYLQLFVKNCIPDQSMLKEFMKQYAQSKHSIRDPHRGPRTEILFEKLTEWFDVNFDSDVKN